MAVVKVCMMYAQQGEQYIVATGTFSKECFVKLL
jgi:hypothetical protein